MALVELARVGCKVTTTAGSKASSKAALTCPCATVRLAEIEVASVESGVEWMEDIGFRLHRGTVVEHIHSCLSEVVGCSGDYVQLRNISRVEFEVFEPFGWLVAFLNCSSVCSYALSWMKALRPLMDLCQRLRTPWLQDLRGSSNLG